MPKQKFYAVKSDNSDRYGYYCPDKLVWEKTGYYNPNPEQSEAAWKSINDLFYSFHSEFEAIVMDMLGDRIDRKTLDIVYSSFDELQEEYHSRIYELLRRGVKNHS